MPGVVKRYFMIVGAILAVLIGGALATKPKIEEMREGVEEGLADYAKAKGIALPAHEAEARDYLLAVSYVAKLADGKTFSCFGVSRLTVCATPEE
jgi:hypothetical protein